MADNWPTLNSWDDVSRIFGSSTSNALQQQGIPLDQVGSFIQQVNPGVPFNAYVPQTGGSGQVTQSSPGGGNTSLGPNAAQAQLSQALNLIGLAQGGGGGSNVPNPFNNAIVGNPLYGLSQLGAAALNQPMIVNPNPAQQPINPQGGVFSGPQMPMISTGVPPVPAGPWQNVPGLMGGQATVPPPSQGAIQPITPFGARPQGPFMSGRPIARPPAAPSVQIPPNITPGAPIAGIPPAAPVPPPTPTGPRGLGVLPEVNYVNNPTTPGTSTGAIALQQAGFKQMQSGGKVNENDTDTVPAMLTPGEYVINKDAAQKIGRDKLDQLNRTDKKKKASKLGDGLYPAHMADGGTVDPSDPAAAWALNQLPEGERTILTQMATAGSPAMAGNPLVMKAQQDYNRLVQQYPKTNVTRTAPTAETPRTPAAANAAAQTGAAPQSGWVPNTSQGNPYLANNFGVPRQIGQQQQVGPGGVYYGNPNRLQVGPQAPAAPTSPYQASQTGTAPGAGGYWPAGSTVYPGQYVVGPSPGTGMSGPILATGSQATQYPAAQAGGNQAAMGIAGGIGAIGQAIAQAFNRDAQLSWHQQATGNWANPYGYESQEQRDYAQYEQPLGRYQIV